MRATLPIVMLGLCAAALALAAARIAWHSYAGAVRDFARNPAGPLTLDPGVAAVPHLQSVTFGADASRMLAAWYVPSRNGAAVILVHGTGAERASLLPETRLLGQAGFGVLTLDLPGQGLSAGVTRWGEPEARALSAAVDWLSARPEVDPGRIGAFGLSFGGYVLLQAALRESRLRALVLASTPEDLDAETRRANSAWGPLSELPALWVLHRYRGAVRDRPPPGAVAQLAPRAVFIVGGERDRLVPPFACRVLFDAARDPKELWIVPGAGHAGFAAVAGEEYGRRLAAFFGRSLPSAAR
jgi:dipeptidyl aminopeptidase/acylaminoacyl peptidase